jgi:hypothetical protein
MEEEYNKEPRLKSVPAALIVDIREGEWNEDQNEPAGKIARRLKGMTGSLSGR